MYMQNRKLKKNSILISLVCNLISYKIILINKFQIDINMMKILRDKLNKTNNNNIIYSNLY
jgi:hypothetical protein